MKIKKMLLMLVIVLPVTVNAFTYKCYNESFEIITYPYNEYESIGISVSNKLAGEKTDILIAEITLNNFFTLAYIAAPIDKSIYSFSLEIDDKGDVISGQTTNAALELNQFSHRVQCIRGEDVLR